MLHPRCSGIKIRNELRFEVRDPVLEFQLTLLHSPQLQLIHAEVIGQADDGRVQVTMFFPEVGYQAGDLARIVFVEAHDTRIVQF